MKKVSLIKAKADVKHIIVEIIGTQNLREKLANMGLYMGSGVIKVSHIGLQGPVVVKSGRSIVALGHTIAEKIIVEE